MKAKAKKAELPKDPTLYEFLEDAGLAMENIILYDPVSLEICVGDKKVLKGLPEEFEGKKITYKVLTDKEIKQIYEAKRR